MDVYKLLKYNNLIKNRRLKFLGLYLLHQLGRRYLAVHFDPVNACNLRCKMCYFSDNDYVKTLKGIFKLDELDRMGESFLKRAIKLQVGCGTEPTLYKDLDKVFELAQKYKVPYVSMTTNANKIEASKLEKWVQSGLNEIVVSLHGVTADTYHEMMDKGDYNKFLSSLNIITKIKQQYPDLRLRVNYTFNEDNFDELVGFWDTFGQYAINVLQLRPIDNIGNSAYNNFSMKQIIPKYENVYDLLKSGAKKRDILFIAPNKQQLTHRSNPNSSIRDYTYCYISPTSCWKKDFDWPNETFDEYSKRTGWSNKILANVFASKEKFEAMENASLNYNLD